MLWVCDWHRMFIWVGELGGIRLRLRSRDNSTAPAAFFCTEIFFLLMKNTK